MATMVPRAAAGRRGAERLFYGAMTLAILMTVFVGFAPTYYLLDSFAGVTPLVHVHAAVFSAWVVLLLAQTSLVAAGRVDLHRRLGIVGVALVPLLLIVGFATTIAVAQRISRPPILAPPGRAMVALIALVAFGVISGLGLALRRNSQAHKRLLLVATINLTIAAVNRLPLPQVRRPGRAIRGGGSAAGTADRMGRDDARATSPDDVARDRNHRRAGRSATVAEWQRRVERAFPLDHFARVTSRATLGAGAPT